jgi:hypothetical protein
MAQLKSPYTYKDNVGHVYPATTNTTTEPCESMESLEYSIQEGGDLTKCKTRVVGAPRSWPAEQVI